MNNQGDPGGNLAISNMRYGVGGAIAVNRGSDVASGPDLNRSTQQALGSDASQTPDRSVIAATHESVATSETAATSAIPATSTIPSRRFRRRRCRFPPVVAGISIYAGRRTISIVARMGIDRRFPCGAKSRPSLVTGQAPRRLNFGLLLSGEPFTLLHLRGSHPFLDFFEGHAACSFTLVGAELQPGISLNQILARQQRHWSRGGQGSPRALASPCSAALRNQSAACFLSVATPSPCSFNKPSVFCAQEFPPAAAFVSHFAASP